MLLFRYNVYSSESDKLYIDSIDVLVKKKHLSGHRKTAKKGEKIVGTDSDLVLNIAIGGCNCENAPEEILNMQISRVLHDTIACAQKFNNPDYCFSGAEIKVNLFSNPFMADDFWIDFAVREGMPLNVIIPYEVTSDEFQKLLSKASSVTNISADSYRSAGSGSVMADWIADQVDLSVFLWNGREEFNSREIWTLIQSCKRNNIPSIWIDINSPENFYWVLDSYYDDYTKEKLEEYIAKLFSKSNNAFDPPQNTKIPLWRLWGCFYDRFMNKYKAQIQPVPYITDKLMDKDPITEATDKNRELKRQKIAGWFHYFDSNAVAYSQKYRISIYLRSIMPFIATMILAVGFYAEGILGFVYKIPYDHINPWSILAGIGFLVHALIYYYMYKLSENQDVQSWHLRFIDNRFVAEVLRLTVHFAPFGIPVNYISSLNRFGNKILNKPHVSGELRRIIRSTETSNVKFDRSAADDLLDNLTHMIDDQIAYNDQVQKRYTAIVNGLKRFTTAIFTLGFAIVVLRGGLQFVLVYVKSDITRNGINLVSFIKSFANMLAMIIPAWASYFSLKLSLSNFEGLANNSRAMIDGLTLMKKMIEDEKKKTDTSFERIYAFSKDLSKLVLGEAVEWYSLLSSQKLTKI